jgi:2-polyprenyl-3-methyl-5-hydroxy-6-metoxy-1,4-benzoquinol methylase
MSYEVIKLLVKKTGSNLSPEDFQEKINIIFHDFESIHYDSLHKDMWQSLQDQIDLLIEDLFKYKKIDASDLTLLDIGCGTGLSTQLILNSKLNENILHFNLLDTSAKMLAQAELKAKSWNKKIRIINGTINDLSEKFDIVIISSVLHHIPNLEVFLNQVDSLINEGGILINIQDPNVDYLEDTIYKERCKNYKIESKQQSKQFKLNKIIPKSIIKMIKRILNKKDYIDLINDQLLKEKLIKVRMSADEIWSVTDIHVENKYNTINKGISLEFLKEQLCNFNLIKMRSYGFFGYLKSDLLSNYSSKEQDYIDNNQRNGRNLSCIWIKNKF